MRKKRSESRVSQTPSLRPRSLRRRRKAAKGVKGMSIEQAQQVIRSCAHLEVQVHELVEELQKLSVDLWNKVTDVAAGLGALRARVDGALIEQVARATEALEQVPELVEVPVSDNGEYDYRDPPWTDVCVGCGVQMPYDEGMYCHQCSLDPPPAAPKHGETLVGHADGSTSRSRKPAVAADAAPESCELPPTSACEFCGAPCLAATGICPECESNIDYTQARLAADAATGVGPRCLQVEPGESA